MNLSNNQLLLEKTVQNIKPVRKELIVRAYERLDNLTKPKRSLGLLEEMAARLVAIIGGEKPVLGKRRICVFVGDHDVVQEGISAYPQEVTLAMAKNFIAGRAAINVLARRAGAEIEVIDIGMANDPGGLSGLVRQNVRRGAGNIAKGPAMTVAEALQAIAVGIERANIAIEQNINILATGEMGIGNTTPAAALHAAYLGLPAAKLVGPGTGLDASGVKKKIEVVNSALKANKSRCSGALETLAALGGLEIAGICGLCLGAASRSKPVAVDGFISGAGALAAMRICPAVKDYLFFAHVSAEPGHRKFFEVENLRPIVDLDMRLGEGTGAAIAMQIMEDALAIYNEMATFAEAGIAPGA
ncbi:MAG: nicotinate-nucleotide--dimethylbenzimidazole phosphoribosyltransferase [Kiritimatiellia bacterium]|nr:nicotinate-nucleotide--dimethylbenzimidazole phosphoribosyltransferase [Kiritimatiellia bacterium]